MPLGKPRRRPLRARKKRTLKAEAKVDVQVGCLEAEVDVTIKKAREIVLANIARSRLRHR
jgi:hypothetical protein